jgi:hypothetical protein
MTTVSMLAVVSKKSLKCGEPTAKRTGIIGHPAFAGQKNTTEAAARKSNIESRREQACVSRRWRLQELKK